MWTNIMNTGTASFYLMKLELFGHWDAFLEKEGSGVHPKETFFKYIWNQESNQSGRNRESLSKSVGWTEGPAWETHSFTKTLFSMFKGFLSNIHSNIIKQGYLAWTPREHPGIERPTLWLVDDYWHLGLSGLIILTVVKSLFFCIVK